MKMNNNVTRIQQNHSTDKAFATTQLLYNLKRVTEVVEDGDLQHKLFSAFRRVRQRQRDKERLERRYLYTNY